MQTLHKPDILGRLTKWAIEVSEYDITFILTKAIKAQASVDFIANTSTKEGDKWKFLIDGMILLDKNETKIEYAIHFLFPTTNNGTDYEAFSVGLRITKNPRIPKIEMISDSIVKEPNLKNTKERF